MPEYTIEMLWDCSQCGQSKNKCITNRNCTKCGKTRNHLDREYPPDDISENAALTDAQLEKLGPGTEPDRLCPYCDYLNDRDWDKCKVCGAPKADGSKGYKAKFHEVTENADGSNRRANSWDVDVDGGREGEPSISPAAVTPEPPKKRKKINLLPFQVVAAIALFVWFLVWLFTPKVLRAEVRELNWEHTVEVQRNQLMPASGWDPPYGAEQVENRGTRLRRTDRVPDGYDYYMDSERYQCGENCYTTPRSCRTTPRSCRSKGDGTMSCSGGDTVCSGGDRRCSPKYCDRPVQKRRQRYRDVPIYDNWYSWKEWRWVHNRYVTHSGGQSKTTWPSPEQLNLTDKERTSRTESYSVTLVDEEGERRKYAPKSETEFKTFTIGKKETIEVGALGVSIVRKP